MLKQTTSTSTTTRTTLGCGEVNVMCPTLYIQNGSRSVRWTPRAHREPCVVKVLWHIYILCTYSNNVRKCLYTRLRISLSETVIIIHLMRKGATRRSPLCCSAAVAAAASMLSLWTSSAVFSECERVCASPLNGLMDYLSRFH